MENFFKIDVLNKIKNLETGVNCVEKFISKNEAEEILDYLRNLKNKSVGKSKAVEREESTKIFFDFNQTQKLKNLKKRIEEVIGEFYVNDFQPHIITSRYPLRLHADTGKNPNDIIYKNVIIPMEIVYKPEAKSSNPPNTIIFKNKWFDQSALFSSNINSNTDFIIKDKSKNFIDIMDINDFYNELLKYNNSDMSYKGNVFFVDESFKNYIEYLTKSKRYNQRTNKHIISDKKFDMRHYENYMSHQPYNDLQSLEIDRVIEWKIGDLVYWDRCRIHSSDNFLKNNVLYKTPLAMFTSKKKI
ncbi:MAG: hypothetical protein CBC53_005465 [Alphaproteobacteria bacterium TMED93]|nr:MAG: hypothetical protein CBC53_005465 [Alphaproteobacteria bacterium TMED93]